MVKADCLDCEGGVIKNFSHVSGGVCFKCNGKGFVNLKSERVIQKTYSFLFLWTDPKNCNYNDGKFLLCFSNKKASMKKAMEHGKKMMEKNGSQDFKVVELKKGL